MKNHRFRHFRRLFSFLILAVAPLRADEPELRELLREALFTEEVSRDPALAAEQYQAILARHDEQRSYAASALFRLAELRRKQARDDEAAESYQRLLRDFPEAAAEARLAREALAVMGVEIPAEGAGPGGAEVAELQRVEELANIAPDLLRDPATLEQAVVKGWPRVVSYLLGQPGKVASGQLLKQAAASGHLEICRLLLQHQKPSPQEAGSALVAAIENDRRIVLAFLLDEGLDPDSPVPAVGSVTTTPLFHAVASPSEFAANLLLDRGADIESQSEFQDEFRGTALHAAVMGTQLGTFKLLLERGANVDAPDPDKGVTPLHLAADGRFNDSQPMLELLLEKGADPNVRTVDGKTTLESANTPAKTAALLAAGATLKGVPVTRERHPLVKAIEEKQLELVDELLKAGGVVSHAVILETAIAAGDEVILGRLLDAGLDPGDPELSATVSNGLSDALMLAAPKGNAVALLELLIAKGAKPADPAWIRGSAGTTTSATPEARKFLLRHFVYPELAEKPAITFHGLHFNVFNSNSTSALLWKEAATRSGEGSPPDLVNLLLEHGKAFFDNRNVWPREVTLVRRDAEGKIAETVVPLHLEGKFPELQWGDIIRAESAPDGLVGVEWPNSLRWHLVKRLRLPVTVEIGGETREILVRGDRLTFDPAKPEVPLVGAGRLIELLWQPVDPRANFDDVEVVVRRTGWQEIRMPFRNDRTTDFPLQAGDQVSLSLPEPLVTAPRGGITLTVPGLPFTRNYPVPYSGQPGALGSLTPTFFQVVTDALVPKRYISSGPPPAVADMPAWQLHSNGNDPSAVLAHPDFSRIRLRRVVEGEAEEVIEMDLAAMIAAADEATPEEVRAMDLALRPGDIVELPVHTDRDEPWTGLPEKEAGFFAKALNASVQVTTGDGEIRLINANYAPIQFVHSEAGPFAMTGDGIPKFLATDILNLRGSVSSITRGGNSLENLSIDTSNLFLRHGDQVVVHQVGGLVPLRRVGTDRQPRGRVVPPPSAR